MEGKTMRVFVTGATGALGRHLVPGLVAAGHEVTATTRTPGKMARLREAGAEPVVVDGLDREAVIAAVRAAAPEVIVHEMTALADMRSFRNPDKLFAVTNELRTRGTDNLLAAAAQAGTRRVIAQGYAGPGPDQPSGARLKTEEDPLDWRPIRSAARAMAAIRYVDRTVPLEVPEGIVLRYGGFYGPGTGDFVVEMARKRRLPVIGGGTGVWSFIEVTDAAAATLAAVDHGAPGVYNVVDGAGRGVAAVPGQGRGREATAARARLARAAARRGVRRGPDDQLARFLEREGKERARLGAAVRELAGGIPCLGPRMIRARPGTGRCCSPSPTG
jgi:nucleoside-diphosphate-sugar epimerase